MKQLDMTGHPCPIPVVQAKKALVGADVDAVEVLVDNIVAVQNLEKMATGLGYAFQSGQDGDKLYRVALGKSDTATMHGCGQGEPACCIAMPPSTTEGPTVLITQESLGGGAEELGNILIKGFLFSLTELSPPPKAVIFLNGGAKLTTQGANTVPDLKALEEKGVEILTCGTCANYFGLTEQLAVGAITDMMGITSRIATAGRLISL